jgi:hypothetical protein
MLPLLHAAPHSESLQERSNTVDFIWTVCGATSIILLSLSMPTPNPTPASEPNRVIKYPLGCRVRAGSSINKSGRGRARRGWPRGHSPDLDAGIAVDVALVPIGTLPAPPTRNRHICAAIPLAIESANVIVPKHDCMRCQIVVPTRHYVE